MRSSASSRIAGLVARAAVVAGVIVLGAALTAVSPLFTVALIALLLFAFGGWLIGEQKGRGRAGLFLGLFLGPIGLFLVAVMEPTDAVRARRDRVKAAAIAVAVGGRGAAETRACPWCAEAIKVAAIICRHCGRDVAPAASGTTGSIGSPKRR